MGGFGLRVLPRNSSAFYVEFCSAFYYMPLVRTAVHAFVPIWVCFFHGERPMYHLVRIMRGEEEEGVCFLGFYIHERFWIS